MLLALLPHLTWEDVFALHSRGYEHLAEFALGHTSDVAIIQSAAACDASELRAVAVQNKSAPLELLVDVASGGEPELKKLACRALQLRFSVSAADLSFVLGWLGQVLACTPEAVECAVRSLEAVLPYEASMLLLSAVLEHRAPLSPAAVDAVVDAICDPARQGPAGNARPMRRTPRDVRRVLLATHDVPPDGLRRLLAGGALTPEEERLIVLALAAAGDLPDVGEPLPLAYVGDFTRMPEARALSPDVAEMLFARGEGWAELVAASGSLTSESAARHALSQLAQAAEDGIFVDDVGVRLLPDAALSGRDIDALIDIAESFADVPYFCEQILHGVARNPACQPQHQVRMLSCIPSGSDDLTWFVEGPPSALARNPSVDPEVAVILARAVSDIVRARGTLCGSRRWALQALLANPAVDDATKLLLPASLFWLALPYIPWTVALLNERLGRDLGRWATYASLAPDWEGSTHDLLVSIGLLSAPAGGVPAQQIAGPQAHLGSC